MIVVCLAGLCRTLSPLMVSLSNHAPLPERGLRVRRQPVNPAQSLPRSATGQESKGGGLRWARTLGSERRRSRDKQETRRPNRPHIDNPNLGLYIPLSDAAV